MKEYTCSAEFPVDAQTFFNLFFSGSSAATDFRVNFHQMRGDERVTVGQWSPLTGNRYERSNHFSCPTSESEIVKKMVGKFIDMEERQTYHTIHAGEIIVETTTNPISGVVIIRSAVKNHITDISKNNIPGCLLQLRLTTELDLSRLPFVMRAFSGSIESMAHDEGIKSMQAMIDQMQIVSVKAAASLLSTSAATTHATPIHTSPHNSRAHASPRTAKSTTSTDWDDEEFYDALDTDDESPLPIRRVHETLVKYEGEPAGLDTLHSEIVDLKRNIDSTNQRLASLEYPLRPISGTDLVSEGSTSQKLLQYIQQIENINQSRLEDEKRRDEAIDARLQALERNLNRLIFPTITWTRRVGAAAFLVVWPWVAFKLWNTSKSLLLNRLNR
ncbi:hypothetical protein PROFUN_02059 [Planoprotostelium fungivorum]|uniref:VASt domain-containing protein n=1 Tax=Planoprotostelium fungivorum TaxID=1890364 RepID=A0A2P6NB87_9EUKA|nr:hypothetical protein PROFUN_02059 [Planoprotostelium fungivorum]